MSKSSRRKDKISTSADKGDFSVSPFETINLSGLPSAPQVSSSVKIKSNQKKLLFGNGERLEIRREKSGRGGKTVTTINGFPSHLGKDKKDKMLKVLKSSLGTGGTWASSTMELQGDRRDDVYYWLKDEGFTPVLAGG